MSVSRPDRPAFPGPRGRCRSTSASRAGEVGLAHADRLQHLAMRAAASAGSWPTAEVVSRNECLPAPRRSPCAEIGEHRVLAGAQDADMERDVRLGAGSEVGPSVAAHAVVARPRSAAGRGRSRGWRRAAQRPARSSRRASISPRTNSGSGSIAPIQVSTSVSSRFQSVSTADPRAGALAGLRSGLWPPASRGLAQRGAAHAELGAELGLGRQRPNAAGSRRTGCASRRAPARRSRVPRRSPSAGPRSPLARLVRSGSSDTRRPAPPV